jgi:hypothetical protein
LEKTDSSRVFYLKGIYSRVVLSGVQDGLVEVRAETTFLHTSAYSDGKRQVRVSVTQKRWLERAKFWRFVSSRLVASAPSSSWGCVTVTIC